MSSLGIGNSHMLSELNMKCPAGTARNKQLEGEAEATHGVTDTDRVRAVVDVFNTDYLKKVRKIHTKLRNDHIQSTLPWAERGPRLTANQQVRPMRDKVDAAIIEADVAWAEFMTDLEHHKARDRQVMGTLFDESMYPSAEDLQGRHSIEIIFSVVPDADHDVRAGWDTQTVADYKKQVTEKESQRVSKAMQVVQKRCHDYVYRVFDRCNSYDGKKVGSFNDSLVPNVKDMMELCSLFNFNDDPEIKAWIAEMGTSICNVTSQELRESPELRDTVGAAAGKLATRIAGANVGAFGQAPALPSDDR
jgi:hypothetical protein